MIAIYTPTLGAPSETFVRRHIEQIAPGQTVVICDAVADEFRGWESSNLPVHCTSSFLNWNIRRFGRTFLGGPLPGSIDPLVRYIKRHTVDVVLGEFMDQFLPVYQQLHRNGIQCFVHAHGYDVSSALNNEQLARSYSCYAGSAGIITMSNASKRALSLMGLPPEKIHVVPYGVDIPERRPPSRLADQTVRCLAVGRMTAKKAPLLLLESFSLALGSGANLHLEYIGGGELFDAAAQFVRVHGLEDTVVLHGARDSAYVAARLNESDIFLQHSVTDPLTGDMEGLPVAILEAMANGLPVVSTLHAGIPEQVVDGVTGFLVPERDVQAMARRISELASSAELRKAMGEAGLQRARQHFSWEQSRKTLCRVMGLPV
jgi:colanic acid/amylovoran biosynthesis glycosyltransferase